MNSFPMVAVGIGIIILCSGAVKWISIYMKSTYGDGRGAPAKADELHLRLDEMDKRLHDVLDVMIDLSEKFDRWEAQQLDAGPAVRG